MKIYILNVKYSENLGDGIISDCLEYCLIKWGAEGVDVMDLSLKTEFSGLIDEKANSGKKKLLGFFRNHYFFSLIIPFLNFCYSFLLLRKINSSTPPDLIVVGGGQIVSDVEHFFSGRLFLPILYMRSIKKVKTAFYAVGVSAQLGWVGRIVFKKILGGGSIYVRDEMSKVAVRDQLALGSNVVPDIGILSSKVYSERYSIKRDIGLCVSAPTALSLHSSDVKGIYNIGFYVKKIKALVDGGRDVSLFTNGLEEDHSFMIDVESNYISTYGSTDLLKVESRFTSPELLVSFISSCNYIFAHRMHACIVAISYGIPAFGFGWDRKLESFYLDSGIKDLFIPASLAGESCPLKLIDSADSAHLKVKSERLIIEAESMHLDALQKLIHGECYES